MRNKIVLAGLLHDIGKFWQRADKPRGRESAVDEYSKNEPLLKHICPPKNNNQDYYPAYIHALWTSKFFESNQSIFNNVKQDQNPLFRVNIYDENNEFIEDNVTNLASCHHNPHTFHQGFIQLADWWSSGLDRRNAPDSESEITFQKYKDVKFGQYPFRKIPLYSIFNMINLKSEEVDIAEELEQNTNFGYKLSPLKLDGTLFPNEITNKNAQQDLDYGTLWNQFEDEFQKLPIDSWKGFITSLLYLLKKYTWCIPSSTPDLPYVSLYEHLKSTAAIAGCLYDYSLENPEAIKKKANGNSLAVDNEHEPLRLVSIDISGIQDFIYNISSAKAYRSLKGRSFYLTLLLDAVVTRFLNKIGHTQANVVYASGGKAFILAPNIQKTSEAIDALLREIERKIFDEHHGRLYVTISSLPFSYRFSDKADNNDAVIWSSHYNSMTTLADLWTALIKKGDRAKNQKFKSLITSSSNFHHFFSNEGLPGVYSNPDEICAVTGESPSNGIRLKNIGGGDNELFVLPQVADQTMLGEALKDCDYIFKYDKPTGEENNYLANRVKTHIEPCNLGIHYYLIDESQLADDNAEFRSITSGDGTEVLRLNNTDFLWTGKLKGNDASYGYLFYGGNKQPESNRIRNDGKYFSKTFEELCKLESRNNSTGEARLGVLRMDVDNLGRIFSSGFPNEYRSFAAYGTLSFMLDLFFSGYLNNVREKYKDEVTIVYSGGDDVFAVGRWDQVINFGMDVREEFRKFTINPNMTLSGGMVLVNASFPISKSADMAGEEEKKAKKGKKDAFVFFGEKVQWGEEFQNVVDLKDTYTDLVINQGMTRSLLHQMQKYKAIKDEGQRRLCEGKHKDWSYKWHSAYHLGRYGERYKNKPEIKGFVDDLSNGIIHDGKPNPDQYLNLVALAARWSEYELKIIK